MSENTYTLSLRCVNCDHRWQQELERGTPLAFYGVNRSTVTCPNCGCATASRDDSPRRPRWDRGPWMDIIHRKGIKAFPRGGRSDTRKGTSHE